MNAFNIYAYIFENKIKNIACFNLNNEGNYELANQLARITFGDTAFAVEVTQYPVTVDDLYENGSFYRVDLETQEKQMIHPLPTEEQQIATLDSKTTEISEQLNPTINKDTCTVDELKAWQINLSKNELAIYLQEHPLVSNCHGNKTGTYTITEEKQTLFTSKYTAHVALLQAGIEDAMTWNESGQPCEEWTDEECIAFITEWNSISTPLVKHQQDLELEIESCETKEDILAIIIDYSIADPRN